MSGDIEAHADLHDRAILEGQHAGDMGRDMDRDRLTLLRLAGDEPLVARRNGKARDFGDRSQQVNEIGNVIGSHIQHRPAANLVVEGGIRVPALMAGAHEGRRPTHGNAENTFIY